MKILIVEDDAKTATAIASGLSAEGYSPMIAPDGDRALVRLHGETFDLVLLDWMLPGCDGIAVLNSLRRTGPTPLVMLLTARDTVEDRVLGLDSGADDYLVKPFAYAELLARLRALCRRKSHEEPRRDQVAGLDVDSQRRFVSRDGEEIPLTPREFDLLDYLMRHEGHVVTRAMLAKDVWREPNRSTPLDNVIDVHLARLRRKLDDGRNQKMIRTIRGVGFVFGIHERQPA